MKTLVFCLEEPSAKAMLEGVLPRMLPGSLAVKFIIFKGKQDLEKQLVKRLRGWRTPDTQFVVMRDQDAADCHDVRGKLVQLCKLSGRSDVLVRVACRELESFYLGDLSAVEKGLKLKGVARQQVSRKFRNPDQLVNPVQEITQLTGERYQKISGSRAIGPHLHLTENRSKSFLALVSGVKRLVDEDFENRWQALI